MYEIKKTFVFYVSLIFIASLIQEISGQDEVFQSSICVQNDDCETCLRAGDFCYWCDHFVFYDKSNPSCNIKDILLRDGCPSSGIIGNKKTYTFITEDKPLNDLISGDISEAIQIKPQRVSIEIKPGDTHSVAFEYRLARNYPLDLYYLMDLTWSMRDDKDTLVGLRDELPITLQRLTNNFKLGFGIFADKPLMPYTAMDPKHKENPCSAELSTCEPTYTFKHRLSLTNEVDRFVFTVNASSITANLDNMEATLEALMQVLVCTDKIGWSTDSRKIVVLPTDGLTHFAGMGKLGGVVKRNDEQCYVNDDGSYSASTSMDYPSLDQIDRILTEKKINVIFAVTMEVKDFFDKINELLPDTTYVGKLESDSSNILNLVKQGYEDFSSVISFEDDAEDFFRVRYFSNCGGEDIVETSKCEHVKQGETYKFFVNVSMDYCKVEHHGTRKIVISETHLGNSALALDLNLHCKCECAQADSNVVCPQNSVMQCGKCTCLPGWVGPHCECRINDDASGGNVSSSSCISPNDHNHETIVCSGAGDCFCGTCLCDPGYTGKYCECRECSKDFKTGTVCGGPNRGVCSCGQCVCRDGYEGPTCSCPTGTKACILPGDKHPCSGRGTCRCGECVCARKNNENIYAGKFCDVCTDCDNPACQLYEDCAKAAVRKETASVACVSSTGALYKPTVITNKNISPPDNASLCYFYTEENEKRCQYSFTYQVGKDWTVDIKVYFISCWGLVDTALLAFPVFFITLLLGMCVIVIWKCVTYYKDKEDYRKFVAERNKQLESMKNQGENPIYKSPITMYQMPDDFNITELIGEK